MGVKDTGMPARTLGRNAPIHTAILTIEPLDPQGSQDFTLRISEFTQAFEIVITNRGNLDDPLNQSNFLFLVNSQNTAQAIRGESLEVGQKYRQIIPGWKESVNVTGIGVNNLDYVTRQQVTVAIAVYQLDRVTRDEYLGSG